MCPRILIIAAALVLLASSACADGFYVSVLAGANFPQSSTAEFNDATNGNDANVSFGTGFRTDGVIGYQWGFLRFEGEFVYQWALVDKLEQDGAKYSARGGVKLIGGMANIWADIPTGTRITPYFGAGAGLMYIEPSQIDIKQYDIMMPFSSSESDSVFAWQLGAGFSTVLTKKLVLDIGYRFFTSSTPHFKQAKTDVIIHNVMVGIRYNFF